MFITSEILELKNEPDQEKIAKMYMKNIGLIRKMVSDRVDGVQDSDDMMQNAYLALCKSIESWTPGKYPFTAYLRMNIKSINFAESLKLDYSVRLHSQNYKNPPERAELSDILCEDEGYTFVESSVMCNELCDAIKELLTPREYNILIGRVCRGKSLSELSDLYHVSKARIAQIESRALGILRNNNELRCKFKESI